MTDGCVLIVDDMHHRPQARPHPFPTSAPCPDPYGRDVHHSLGAQPPHLPHHGLLYGDGQLGSFSPLSAMPDLATLARAGGMPPSLAHYGLPGATAAEQLYRREVGLEMQMAPQQLPMGAMHTQALLQQTQQQLLVLEQQRQALQHAAAGNFPIPMPHSLPSHGYPMYQQPHHPSAFSMAGTPGLPSDLSFPPRHLATPRVAPSYSIPPPRPSVEPYVMRPPAHLSEGSLQAQSRANVRSTADSGLALALDDEANRNNMNKRWVLEPEDVMLLERVFLLEKCPGRELRQQLSTRLNVRPRQIQVWFQNKRQRAKSGAKPTVAESLAHGLQSSDASLHEHPAELLMRMANNDGTATNEGASRAAEEPEEEDEDEEEAEAEAEAEVVAVAEVEDAKRAVANEMKSAASVAISSGPMDMSSESFQSTATTALRSGAYPLPEGCTTGSDVWTREDVVRTQPSLCNVTTNSVIVSPQEVVVEAKEAMSGDSGDDGTGTS
mmetsp:Transcript_31632/g.78800  ORF Transcript_31632/g.78800 Transcript_31632/m.78800 type:complete len:494 (+) Transcript_31632:41-1522(+)